MDNSFSPMEKLYRAVYPPSYNNMYWKKDGSLSSAAFADKNGLSVERGYFRDDSSVLDEMNHFFTGSIVSVTVQQYYDVSATVKYLPSKRSIYHSEIHGDETHLLFSKSQRKRLALQAKILQK